MYSIFLKHKILTILMFTFLLLSILCHVVAGVIYQSMIAEAENMSSTKNKLLKQCKQKYAGYYKLNGKMVNTGAFVDKFLQKICILKIPLSRFSHLAGQLMMLSVLFTGISVCVSLAAGDTLFQIIPYYLVSILGLYLYFSVAGITDLQEKRKALKIHLMDYLENHFIPRLEIEKEAKKDKDDRSKTVSERLQDEYIQSVISEKKNHQDDVKATYQFDYTEELEDLLKEFLA